MSYMNMIVQGLYIWKAPHPLASQLSIVLCGVWEQPQAYSNSHIPQSKIQAPTCWCVGASIKRGEIKMNSTMRPSIGQVSLVEYFFWGGSCRRASPHPSSHWCIVCFHSDWCIASQPRYGGYATSNGLCQALLSQRFCRFGFGFGAGAVGVGGYLGIQDEIRHERIHESWLRWITIY